MKRLIAVFALMLAPVFFVTPVLAVDVLDPACQNVSPTPPACTEKGDNLFGQGSVLAGIVRLFSIAIGVIAVIMIIIAGIKFVTSSGDPASVTGARNTILYAAIGLVVAAIAQLIVIFILDKV